MHLHEVELVARGYTGLGQNGLSLDRDLLLPDFAEPSKRVWPPYETPLGVLVAEAVAAGIRGMPDPRRWEEGLPSARRKASGDQT
jgi:hypothetical protein